MLRLIINLGLIHIPCDILYTMEPICCWFWKTTL